MIFKSLYGLINLVGHFQNHKLLKLYPVNLQKDIKLFFVISADLIYILVLDNLHIFYYKLIFGYRGVIFEFQ